MKARIVVVDDDVNITKALKRGLTYEGYEVEVANDGEEALQLIRRGLPDLVVLDLMLPGIDGLEVCRRLRAAGDPIPILMLTAKDELADKVAGLETGADDYLVKPFAFEELLARVHALLRRYEPDDRLVRRYDDLTLDEGRRVVRRGDRVVPLSAKEYELLSLFLHQPERVLSRDILLEKVWGYDFAGESNVLDVYIRYLRAKLEEEGEKRLIHTVRGVGYVLRE
ncbi:MAG: response regulator transcription factor [Chloroflexi bacterium]|nr:response regulator transcription factor [Chloroflexota bacterium]